jgi:hypothetical protein
LIDGGRFAVALEAQIGCVKAAHHQIEELKQPSRIINEDLVPWLTRGATLACDFFEHGNTYYWSTEAVSLLEYAARSIPQWHLLHADGRPNLPSLQAFHYFERPPRERDGSSTHARAIAWTPLLFSREDPGLLYEYDHWTKRIQDGRFVWNQEIEELSLDVRGLTDAQIAKGDLDDCTPLWTFDHKLTQHFDYLMGPDFVDETKDDGQNAEISADRVWWARLVAAIAAFARQRIGRVFLTSPPRPWRRRLPSWWTLPPLVRVIHLTPLNDGRVSSGESRPVDWSCRWMVRGHWRNQYHPSIQRHDPLWIMEYVKGPEGKPLRLPAATIVAL